MITRQQHKELLSMLPHGGSYGKFTRAVEKAVPVTAAERAARRLLAKQEKRRDVVRQRLARKFDAMKMEAREAIHFGNDVKVALKKIAALRGFCK